MIPQVSHIEPAIREAQASSPEPLCAYVYDLDGLRSHARALKRSLPENCELFYAIKANSDGPLLEALSGAVDGFEVSSGGELDWVRGRFPDIQILFSGPGKTDAELTRALDERVTAIHVESPWELQRLARLAKAARQPAPVFLRANPHAPSLAPTGLTMGGRPTPFGMDEHGLRESLRYLRGHPALRFEGVHMHLLSHQLDATAQLDLIEACIKQVTDWQALGLRPPCLNLGGGIGINYRAPDRQFDWDRFSTGLAGLLERHGLRDLPIRFEFGRYISGACGYYVAEVLDIKRNLGKTFAVVRGGTHHFRTPPAQGHSHPFSVLPTEDWSYPFVRPCAAGEPITVVGQLCTPKDVLASDVVVEQVRVGDLLVFTYAGAYAWHISHHDFLRHPHPMQLYLGDRGEADAEDQSV